MHPNQALLIHFYESFGRRDAAAMSACYAPTITFTDPVFTLQGQAAGAMWHMLCASGSDLAVTFRDIQADDQRGSAHWEARYTFSSAGRRVHNLITAEFTFAAGLIVAHRDQFDFWRWSRQALGPLGWALGWTPLVRGQVQRTARRRLERYLAAHPELRMP